MVEQNFVSECHIVSFLQAQLANQPSFPVMCTYHLEKGQMMEPYYVLGKLAPGMHASIQMYPGNNQPSFFNLEARVIKILLDEQQGNRTAFAAASFKPVRQPNNEQQN